MPAPLPIAVLEAGVLIGAAAWTGLRLVTPALVRAFPRVAAMLAGSLLVWIGAVVLLARHVPAALHVLTPLAVAAVVFAVWRGRPGYGSRARLPPGSLSMRDSLDALLDRDFYRARAARHGPVFKMAQFHQPVVCMTGLERAHRLLHDHEADLGPSTLTFSREFPTGFLRYMPAEVHAYYGPLFRQALSAQVISRSGPAALEIARQELDASAAGAAAGGDRARNPSACFDRIVSRVFMRVLFGLDAGTPAFDRFTAAGDVLASVPLHRRLTPAARAALDDLRAVAASRRDELCGNGAGDDACVLAELVRLDGRPPDGTSLDNLIFIYRVTTANVIGLLRWLLVMLASHPEWKARLAREVQASPPGTPPALVDRIIRETLRLSQSEYLYRKLVRDVDFEGFRLPRGWLVRICVWESHRSEESFEHPDSFDPDRFLARDHTRATYLPFGTGPHACNGVPLTNLICRAVLEQLARRDEWTVTGYEPLQRDFRHWSHWRPSDRMRLHLAPAAPPAPASATGRDSEAAAAVRSRP